MGVASEFYQTLSHMSSYGTVDRPYLSRSPTGEANWVCGSEFPRCLNKNKKRISSCFVAQL